MATDAPLSTDDRTEPDPNTKLGLPLPRLQLTWVRLKEGDEGYDNGRYNWLIKYELLIPLPMYDIRNHEKRGYLPAELGGTRSSGEQEPLNQDGTIRTPFRDGQHILWDSIALGFPAFVVYKDRYRRLTPRDSQWPPLEDCKS